MPYQDTLFSIAEYVADEGLKKLIIQLVKDLDAEFKATTAYNEALMKMLSEAITEFKVITGERYIKLEHKLESQMGGVQNKVHTLANMVSALQYKIEDLVELITKDRE